jgi:hypothetical protein
VGGEHDRSISNWPVGFAIAELLDGRRAEFFDSLTRDFRDNYSIVWSTLHICIIPFIASGHASCAIGLWAQVFILGVAIKTISGW